MKYLIYFNLALSFSALVMLDTEASSLWAVLMILVWFAFSALVANRFFRNK